MNPTDPITAAAPTTGLPPWTLPEAAPGRGRQETAFPAELRGTDDDLVRACWAVVLSRCTGESEVTTAVTAPSGSLGALTAQVGPVTWAELAAGLRTRPLLGEPHSVLDLYGTAVPGAHDLTVAVDRTAGLLSADYDGARVSHRAAERLLGYLGHALALAVADPGAPVDLAGMLDGQEVHRQLTELCGPRVNNGPDGFVQAFRARAAAHPDRPAVHHHDTVVGYGELDLASDRIAHHLRQLGLGAGEPVAVVCDRHTDWVAALIGVLKAGGVYLPVRPDFPAARVLDQLTRAECSLALTDAAGAELMAEVAGDERWRGVAHRIDALAATPAPGGELPAPELGRPAYVYFTSGSTGRPKGAVCAHDGMINHLWAKVDDHGLGPGDVVTQTASQCFDISLWQICAPLLIGGSTVIVDVDEQLDVAAFAALLARRGVTTIQIVPSYLEVLLAHLEAGVVRLPRLTSVSVTGEALKADLVRRWFAAVPGVRLVNAYGATEVSDDTMHTVLDGPPERRLAVVDVGRPLRNMRVYVVDDQLRLMPEGARGEIVFAGVCVGGGYLNDPERTAAAFHEDPYVPGERLYRSGDLGRWLPEGRLEFLGRRDEQIKLRGLRVEIGEIQTALAEVPGVSAAAVVTVGEGNGARLVGFYVSDLELSSVDLHDLLSARLPSYMVPGHHFRLPELPLNENGKTDKRRLKELAAEMSSGLNAFEPPAGDTERRLAVLWSEVLGTVEGRVGRHDDFFDLGGTSLSAIHLLMRLEHRLSLTDLLGHPVLHEQARLLDEAAGAGDGRLVHELSPAGPARPVLLCLPDAGGNAINFQRLADLAGDRLQVLAVELPGHDLARPDEQPAGLTELAGRLAAELEDWDGLHLWGQGAGAAAALATARALEAAGGKVAGVLAAWDDTMPERPAELEVAALDDATIADLLSRRQAYVEVDGATPGRLAFVAKAYRHDWAEALRVLAGFGADGPGLDCPVTELTLGGAAARLPEGAPGTTRLPLAQAAGDLARALPETVIGLVMGEVRP
ncbi:amino acid adenylation domain-containing protein [Streptomyces bacillaris]|uniref:non-ribosomal peptide synthetase n=1 Tax=Streptomyces bacillaris TaxID=68179 RepID=UPI0035DDBE56